MAFEDFIRSNFKNEWLSEDGGNLSVYVRKFTRIFPEGHTHIDVATFNAEVMGTGSLTRFLDRIEPDYSIYVENVYGGTATPIGDRLWEYFERRGYRIVPPSVGFEWVHESMKSFYRIVDDETNSPAGFGSPGGDEGYTGMAAKGEEDEAA